MKDESKLSEERLREFLDVDSPEWSNWSEPEIESAMSELLSLREEAKKLREAVEAALNVEEQIGQNDLIKGPNKALCVMFRAALKEKPCTK